MEIDGARERMDLVFLLWLAVWWLIGLFFIDWKRWRVGYPTALAGSLGSFLLDAAFVSGGFWTYRDPWLPGMWPHITLNLGIYLVGGWIFVQRYPEEKVRQMLWILLGTVILLTVEFNLREMGVMLYRNGWNIAYSAVINVLLLGLLRMHFKMVESRNVFSDP